MGTAASRFASSGRRAASRAAPSGVVNESVQVQSVWVPISALASATTATASAASRAVGAGASAARCVAASLNGSAAGALASSAPGYGVVAVAGANVRAASSLAAAPDRGAAVAGTRRQQHRHTRGRMPGAAAVAAGIGMLGLAVGMCAPAVALCEGDEAAGAGAQEASGSDGSSTDGNKKKERSLFSAEVLENAGLPNPGGFGDLKRSSKLQFQPFDGFVAELTKSFAGEEGQLQIAQNVSLGRTDVQSGGGTYYHLVATYMQGSMMFQGVKTPGANYMTATSRLLDDKLELRFDGQVVPSQDNMSTATLVATYTNEDYASEVTVGKGGGMGYNLGFNYMQSVTSELALGGDIAMMTGLDEVQCNVFGKYSPSSDHTFYNTLHWPNANLTSAYVRNVGDKLRLYSELFMTLDINDPMSKVSAGYEYMLRVEPGPPNPRTGKPDNIPYTTVRGQFESDGRILVGIEQLTLGGQARLKLCAAMNHSRRDYRFGFGMEVNY